MLLMKCIYSIVSLNDGRRYIGSAKHFFYRRNLHLHQLRSGKHHNKFLQRAWNKYGEESFRFGILSVVGSNDELIQTEQAWIDGYKPEYNICQKAGSQLGRRATPETREKLRLSHLGKHPSAETLERMSRSQSISQLGRVVSAQTRAKLSAKIKGCKHTPEAIEKIRAASKGRGWSPACRVKQMARLKGRIISQEQRAKISATMTGSKWSVARREAYERTLCGRNLL